MSIKPTRDELTLQAQMARLEADLAAARAEAARLRLELVERDLADAPATPNPPPPVASAGNVAPPPQALAPKVPSSDWVSLEISAKSELVHELSVSKPESVVAERELNNGTLTGPQAKANGSVVKLPAESKIPPGKPVEPPKSRIQVRAASDAPARQRPKLPLANVANFAPQFSVETRPSKHDVKLAVAPPPIVDQSVAVAEETVEIPRLLLSSYLARQMGAWSLSMLVHLACLILLALTMLPAMLKPDPPLLEALLTRDEELIQELEEPITAATEVTTNTVSSVMTVGHKSSMEGPVGQTTFDTAVADSVEGPKVTVGDVSLYSIKGRDLGVDVPEGAPGDPQAIVDNYDQAFDRITQEIRMMLMKNKVLVVWLFDQSESMKDDQQEIRARIDRVYSELGLIDQAKGDALLTSVASYGAKWQLHTKKPTYDIEQIRAAINEITVDETGLEMTCDAVGATVTALTPVAIQGRRQLALILVSDESGDQRSNVDKLEEAIAAAKAARTRIYILGREAVFGYPYAHMRWSAPGAGTHWLPIDRGPETPFVEQLQTEGFQRRYDAHCSGFGPYEHCRMARETGGIFFMLPSLETDLVRGEKRRYELEAMRPYMPDLGARHEYAFERDKSQLRATIWKVITDLNPYRPEIAKHIDLRHHFSADIPTFINQVNAEQAKALVYVSYLHEAEKAMEKLGSRRDNEPYPRWRANYDLIMAQILAYKVHVYEYRAYLEEFKKNPKQVPLTKPNNVRLAQWDIRHRQKTVTGEETRSYIERSRALFNKVIAEHAGTPWAARAEWELKRGFGVELVEHYVGPPGPPRPSRPPVKIPKL